MYYSTQNFTLLLAVFARLVCSGATAADSNVPPSSLANSALVSATATVLARADVAFARSRIVDIHYKGAFGENVAGKTFLRNYLQAEGGWESITPRSGRQGFDHVFIKQGAQGEIKDLMIAESKYNTSILSETKDGIQMGISWRKPRLVALGNRYLTVAKSADIRFGKMPLAPNRVLEVVLKNGKRVYFWSESSKSPWKFTGSVDELPEARNQAFRYGKYMVAAGNDQIKYRSRVFRVVPSAQDVTIEIYNADAIVDRKLGKPTALIKLKGALGGSGIVSEAEIAAMIKKKLKLSDADCREFARQIIKKYGPSSLMSKFSLSKTLMVNAGMATGAAVAIDTTIQLFSTGELNVAPLGLTAGSVFSGTLVGQGTHIALTQQKPYNVIKRISGPLRCGTAATTTAFSSLAGGLTTSALMSYGALLFGWTDITEANRNMIIGTVATGTSVIATTGAMALVGVYGTASTGTAISGLSGAAATNATLAWFGGGSVAAGGGGVAAGTAVLAAGGAIIAVGVGVAGYYAYKMYDQHEDTKRIAIELDAYRNDSVLKDVLSNDPYYQQLQQ